LNPFRLDGRVALTGRDLTHNIAVAVEPSRLVAQPAPGSIELSPQALSSRQLAPPRT
jgi:hypothetical protein